MAKETDGRVSEHRRPVEPQLRDCICPVTDEAWPEADIRDPACPWHSWALGLQPQPCDWCGAWNCGHDPKTGLTLPKGLEPEYVQGVLL